MVATGSCPLVGGSVSFSFRQGHVGACIYQAAGFQEDFKKPACCVPSLFIVWPEASQHWSLQAVGWDQVLVRKWQPPRGLKTMSTPQNYRNLCLCLHCEAQPSPASMGDPPVLAGKSGPVF